MKKVIGLIIAGVLVVAGAMIYTDLTTGAPITHGTSGINTTIKNPDVRTQNVNSVKVDNQWLQQQATNQIA